MSPADLFYWLIPWEPSVTVVTATAITAALYLRGCARMHPSIPRQLCFWLGLLSIYIVSHTQFDYYAEHEFFMHRLQHGVLHHLGPFLIALSRPGAVLAAALPIPWRRGMAYARERRFVRSIAEICNDPIIAVLLFCGLILFWLLPSVHTIAMLDWRLYRVMNWGMVVNGLMFWNLALNNYCLRPARLSPAARIMMMLAVIPPQIIIGMLLLSAPHELYPIYSLCGRAFGGITPMADQQIGGFILWVHGAMMSIIGVLAVLSREWMLRKSMV